jgi:hypothetical protein
MADLWRDFWIRETGTGQQVAQLHDRYMIMMMKKFIISATGGCFYYFLRAPEKPSWANAFHATTAAKQNAVR